MIAVLLATYNGARYLAEQLDSIIAQDYQDWKLWVRDDGSTDDTCCILATYAERLGRQMVLLEDAEHVGAVRSFERLLQTACEVDYFCFADQDDVWLPNKLSCTLQAMKDAEQQQEGAVVVFTDGCVVDESLQPLGQTIWEMNRVRLPFAVCSNIVGAVNPAAGCTMMLNVSARQLVLPLGKDVPVHDWWIAARVAKYGRLCALPVATLQYRQHQHNQYGVHTVTARHYIHRMFHLTEMWREFSTLKPFLRQIEFGGIIKFMLYKTLYFFIRRM